jgi:Tfp pilus assembly protein PilV
MRFGFKGNNRQIGFTLIEVIMVSFFSVLILGALFALFGWHGTIYNYEQALVRVTSSGRDALQNVFSYTSQAHRVATSTSINGTNYNSNSSTLVLQLSSVSSAGLVIANSWDYAVFYVSGNKLIFELDADSSSTRKKMKKQLSDSVQSLSFTYNNADFDLVTQVSMDLQTQLTARTQVVSNRLQQNAYLKNY